jgi:hypothetical protein
MVMLQIHDTKIPQEEFEKYEEEEICHIIG